VSVDVKEPTPATYRVSALLSGIGAMWRASGPALLLIVVNATIQAALMYLNVQSGFTTEFLASFAFSTASALLLYAVLAACALEAVDGTATLRSVTDRTRHHLLGFSAWTALQWALIVAAALVHPALILVVAAATPFLPLAAMDGHAFALGSNFRVLFGKLGRWLVTTLLLIVAGLLLYLLSAVNTLFVQGTPASAIFWLSIGLVAWWLLTAWALIYRDSAVGSERRPVS
jgi:hypothetical protein